MDVSDVGVQPSGQGDEGSGSQTQGAPAPLPGIVPLDGSTSSPFGSITGFLWADGNGSLPTDWNGLYNGSEATLPGYTVYLYAAGSLVAPIDAATTGAGGAYAFVGLVPGSYVLGIASGAVNGAEYLLPMATTSENKFAIDWSSNPLMAYTGTIAVAAGQNIEDVNAGLRLPMGFQTLDGVTYTIDVNYSAGSLTATGRGYSYNAGKLSFDTGANGNSYTIIRTGVGIGSVSSIEFPAGVTPASVSFNDIDLTGGITFAAGFNANLSFNGVSVRSTPLTLPTGFNADLGINGLTVGTFTLPSDYAEPITFNGITATGGIVYPAGYNEPITIASDFTVQGNQFPTGYTAPLTIGGGTFTKQNVICRPGTSLTSGISGIFLPAHITTITMSDAKTSGSGNLRLWLGSVDNAREFKLLVAGSSDFAGSIEAPVGTILTIDSADSPNTHSENGTLKVTSADNRAAIGGGAGSSGNVTITGATVVATASGGGAGIGGGGSSGVGNVTISGGHVTATTSGGGAGIGGGGSGGTGNVVISGGNVTATARGDGAGIGGGAGGVGNVTITGGTVVATGGNHDTIRLGNGSGAGAGIGGGLDSYGNVTISGGHVTANSIFGAGIGNGGTNSGSPGGATQGNVTITGGTIRGYSLSGASIGRGGGNGYVPTYRIEKEADILMCGRGFYNSRFGIQCSGDNQGDAYHVSMYFDERLRGDLYVFETGPTPALVRILPIDWTGIIYMSFTFSTGHAYSEDFRIYGDYYSDQQVYMGLRPVVHHYDHVAGGTFLNVMDPIIPSVGGMGGYPHNFPGATSDVLYAHIDYGAAPPLFYRVIEKYVDVDGNPLPDPYNPPSYTKADTMDMVSLSTPVYSKTIPAVPGHRARGYFIGAAFNPPTDAYTPGSSITIDPLLGNSTVYFVYNTTNDIEFYKVDEQDAPMAGIYFALYSCTAHDSDPSHVHDWLAASGSCWGSPAAATMSGTSGRVSFPDLTAGDYMLVEVETHAGYQLPHGQWLAVVDPNTLDISFTAHGTGGMLPPAFKPGTGAMDGLLLLPNYREMLMPQAGGAGVAILTAIGIALMGAGVIYLMLPVAAKQGRHRPAYATGKRRHYGNHSTSSGKPPSVIPAARPSKPRRRAAGSRRTAQADPQVE